MSGQARESDRVALFLPSMAGGGAERVFLWLANGLVEKGFGVDLVLFRREGPLMKDLDGRVRVVDLGIPVPFGLLALFPLLSYLKRTQPLVLLSGLVGPNLVANLAKVLGSQNTKFISAIQNMEDRMIEEYGPLKGNFYRILYPLLLRQADHLVAASQGVKDECLVKGFGIPEGKISVIYNPLVRGLFDPGAEGPLVEDWLQEGSGRFIVAVGRLEPQKDYPTLLRAFEKVQKTRPVKLLILGEGSERANLEGMVERMGLKDRVWMPGFVADPMKSVRKASLFVLSSRFEGFCIAVLEAMGCGVPVVSTDCPSGPSELLEKGKWGKLVPVGDWEALAQALLGTLEGPDRADYGDRLLEFEPRRNFEKYLEVMDLSSS